MRLVVVEQAVMLVRLKSNRSINAAQGQFASACGKLRKIPENRGELWKIPQILGCIPAIDKNGLRPRGR
jgi:hypothetical protein